jgi:myosin heavy subunit
MSGKVSLFSIINDNTMPVQFKDSDIISGFQSKLKTPCLEFDKLNKNRFTIIHSQCNVKYDIEGFK